MPLLQRSVPPPFPFSLEEGRHGPEPSKWRIGMNAIGMRGIESRVLPTARLIDVRMARRPADASSASTSTPPISVSDAIPTGVPGSVTPLESPAIPPQVRRESPTYSSRGTLTGDATAIGQALRILLALS
jgi:hypothetical protein